MKNSSKANLIKAVSVGLSASMALSPMTALAAEAEETVVNEVAEQETKETVAEDVQGQASITEDAAQKAAEALKEAIDAQTTEDGKEVVQDVLDQVTDADEEIAQAEDELSDAVDADKKISGQADETVEGTEADTLEDAAEKIDSTNSLKVGKEAYEEAEEAYNRYTEAVKQYEAAVEAAKNAADAADEKLQQAILDAKEAMVNEAANAILAAEDNTAIDWRQQNELFKVILENYYLEQVFGITADQIVSLGGDVKDGALDGFYKASYNQDEYNYFPVVYVDENGEEQTLYLNYKRAKADKEKKYNGVGNEKKIVIFEKTATESYFVVNDSKKINKNFSYAFSADELAKKLADGSVYQDENGEYYFFDGDVVETELEENQTVVEGTETTNYAVSEDGKSVVKTVTGDVTTVNYIQNAELEGGEGFKSEQEALDAANAELGEGDSDLDATVESYEVTDSYEASASATYYTVFETTINLDDIMVSIDSTVRDSERGSEEWYGARAGLAKNILAAFAGFDVLNFDEKSLIDALDGNYEDFVDKTIFAGNKNEYLFKGSITIKYTEKNAEGTLVEGNGTGATADEAKKAAQEDVFKQLVADATPDISVSKNDQDIEKLKHELWIVFGGKWDETTKTYGEFGIETTATVVTDLDSLTEISKADDIEVSDDDVTENTSTLYKYSGTYTDKQTTVDEGVVLSTQTGSELTAGILYTNDEFEKFKNGEASETTLDEKNDEAFNAWLEEARKNNDALEALDDAQKELDELLEELDNLKNYEDDQQHMDELWDAVKLAYKRLIKRQPSDKDENNNIVPETPVENDDFVYVPGVTPVVPQNGNGGVAFADNNGNGEEIEVIDLADMDTPLADFAAEEKAPSFITLDDAETPLVSMDEQQKMNWWWLLIVAVFGTTTGYALYKKHANKEVVVEEKKN